MIIGVEAGGTKVVCASADSPLGPDRSFEPLALSTIPTTTPEETLGRVAEFVVAETGRGPIEGVGVATFGPVVLDPRSPRYATIGETPKLGWTGTKVLDRLRAVTDAPIALETDVTAAALAESRWGAAGGLDDLTYVTVGTGVGVGAIVEGRPLHGTAHPEIGHLTVRRHPDDRFAGVCRLHGDCLEGLASGPAITARWGRRGDSLGDRQDAATRLEAYYLAQLVAALTYLLSPARVILGGGVLATPGLLDAVRVETARLVGTALADHPLTNPASGFITEPGLGDAAGVVGALTLAADLLDSSRQAASSSGTHR